MTQVHVHLRASARQIAAPLAIPAEPATLETWLPFLQALASQLSRAAQDAAVASGRPVTCAKGCGACCHQLVAISLVEARALAQLVARMPEPRQGKIRAGFAAVRERLAESGVAERDYGKPAAEFPLAEAEQQRLAAAWFSLRIACPFLEDESCGIYADRPMIPLAMSLQLPPQIDAALAQPRDPRRMLETLLDEIGEWRIETAA